MWRYLIDVHQRSLVKHSRIHTGEKRLQIAATVLQDVMQIWHCVDLQGTQTHTHDSQHWVIYRKICNFPFCDQVQKNQLCKAQTSSRNQDHHQALDSRGWHFGNSWRWRIGRPDNPGLEPSKTTCDHWTLVWRRQSGVHRTSRHGGYSWLRWTRTSLPRLMQPEWTPLSLWGRRCRQTSSRPVCCVVRTPHLLHM